LGDYPFDFNTAVDYFGGTAPVVGDPGLIVAGPVTDSGMTLDTWVANITKLQQKQQSCASPQASENIRLGGEPGRLLTWTGCPAFVLWAAVVHGNRSYDIIWIDQYANGSGTLQAADKALFKTILASFAFTTKPTAVPSPS
jgi:hypothetical protein